MKKTLFYMGGKREKILSLLLILLFLFLNSVLFIGKPTQFNVKNDKDFEFTYYQTSGEDYIWKRTWGGDLNDKCRVIALDESNNIYIGGDSNSISGVYYNYNMSLLKFDNTGNFEMEITWGGTQSEFCEAMVLDSSNNIFLAGYIDVEPSNSVTSYDFCLVKFDSSGNYEWNRTWGGGDNDYCYSIAFDSFGNIYLAGRTSSLGAGSYDLCVVKFDSSGNYEWNRTWGESDWENQGSIAIDSSDNIYLGGYKKVSENNYDLCLVQFNSLGEYQWNRTFGGSYYDYFSDISLDSSDDIYLAGTMNSDFLLVKYDSNGNYQWNRTWGASHSEYTYSIELDSSNNIYLAGTTQSYGEGENDFCLVKFNNLGDFQWYHTWGNVSSDVCSDIALDLTNNIYLAGWVTNPDNSNDNDMLLYKSIMPDGTYPGHSRIRITNNEDFEKCFFIKNTSADGTKTDPFIFENLLINCNGYGNGIEITNTDVHFIIRNCTIYNSGYDQYNAGLYLEDVVNATILNNTCSYNNRHGMYLSQCNNNTIKDNHANNNGDGELWTGTGIYLSGSDNNIILCNNVDGGVTTTQGNGIYIGGDNNKVINNSICNNRLSGGVGIQIAGHNNTIFNNIINNNERYGIDYRGNFDNNKFIYNIINHNDATGINLRSSGSPYADNTQIINNTINYNEDFGLILYNTRYNNISGNDISFNRIGIELFQNSQNNFFIQNKIKNNVDYGIYIINSVNNNFTENFIESNQYGVYYPSCAYNHNLFYKNYFLDNSVHARDEGDPSDYPYLNKWNNSVIGNLWDDHLTTDNDKDGIDDTPYTGIVGSAGTIDYLPIYINPDPYFINNPENFSIFYGDQSTNIIWTPLDENGDYDSFWVHLNSVNVYNGTWDGSQIIYSDLSNLDIGTHNFTCFVNDTYGAVNSSTLFVTVLFNNPPQIINKTNDFTINPGTNGFNLFWHVIDLDENNHSYWIERNQMRIKEGFWQNNTKINFIELEILPSSIYNYTCFVNDTCGITTQSSIIVRINTNPYYSDIIIPSNNIYSPLASYVFNCTWLDNDGIIQEVIFEFNYHNYTVAENSFGEYTYTLNDLSANEIGYKFKWYAKDNDGAWNSTDWQVFILKKKVMQLMILFNGTEGNYFDAFNPIINLTIINLNFTPGTLRLFVNSELRQEVSAYRLEYISQFLNSKYNITVLLKDVNYTGSAMKWLNIIEETPPEIIFKFSEFYLNSTTPEYFHRWLEIRCTIYDSSPITWVYLCENTSGIYVNNSMISLGNSNWTIILDISNLSWNDIFSFYFYANDTWGNIGKEDNSSMLYSVKIYDFQSPSSKISYIPHSGTNNVNKSTLFSIIANDNQGSGIFETFYSINNSNWINYTKPFDLSDFNPGTYIISFYSVDYAGNIEEMYSMTIILIEEQPPDSPPDEDDDTNQRSRTIPGYNVILFIFGTIFISICFLFKKTKKKSS